MKATNQMVLSELQLEYAIDAAGMVIYTMNKLRESFYPATNLYTKIYRMLDKQLICFEVGLVDD